MNSNSSSKNPFRTAESTNAPESASPFKIAGKKQDQVITKEEVSKPSETPYKQTPPQPNIQNNQPTKPVTNTHTNIDKSVSAMCLRAIYGVTENLGVTELIAKANTLNGVTSLTKISQAEIEALELIHTNHFGLSDCNGLTLTVDTGILNFITVNDTHLAVITESDYEPGVKETITLTAERIAEIS